MSALEKKLLQQMELQFGDLLKESTEGLKLAVIYKGDVLFNSSWGKVYKYYDLASLTKVMFTTSQLMCDFDDKKLKLSDKVSKLLPLSNKKDIQIKGLLSHTAHLQAWNAFYQRMEKGWSYEKRWAQTLKWIDKSTHRKSDKALYSDLDFILLGHYLESLHQKKLINIWEELKSHFGETKLHFCPNNEPKYKKNLYAPTEKCPWRKKILRGEVHDDNTWSLGGVSTHAGLFGRIEDVTLWGQKLIDSFKGKKTGFCGEKTAKRFMKRSLPKEKGDWALGFMMPSPGRASCGQYFSPQSVGHTGFVGTSFWWDPKVDLGVVILSNRVYPNRDNIKFRKVRPLVHDLVYELVVKGEILWS